MSRLEFDKSLYYPLFASALGAAALILIPKRLYKKYFVYGMLFGGAFNVAVILLLSGLLHAFRYLHMGPFKIWNLIPFFTPISWLFLFMVYFHFLPTRRVLFYPYVLSFIGFAYMFGAVMEGLGLFRFYGIYRYIEPVTFVIWFSLAAWAFIKGEKAEPSE